MKQLTSPFYISAEADSWPTGRKRRISAPAYKGSDPINNADIIRLRGKYVSKAGEIFKAIAERCKIFRSYRNEDVGIKFNYSGRSMMESKNKQILRGGPAEDFGKMLTLLPEIIEGAQEIEAHGDRYSETVREDKNLKEMHVLLGAFRDGKAWIPVQLEIKEFRPEAKQANKLYVTVTIQTEAGITSSPTPLNEETLALDTPASVISITELVKNVKDNRGDLLKYLPDSMLSEEQLEIKRTALERDKTKLEEMQEGQSVTQGQQMGERYSISGALEEAYRQSLANYDAAAGRLTKADLQSLYEAAIAQADGDSNLASALYQELLRVLGLRRDDEHS